SAAATYLAMHSYLTSRHLHSFPTRRSSDLARPEGALRGPSRRADQGLGTGRGRRAVQPLHLRPLPARQGDRPDRRGRRTPADREDRKSTRLNSSHVKISYAVFCLKKKTYKQ